MDANGTRFKLLLGEADWADCTDGQGHQLRDVWLAAESGSPPDTPELAWDSVRSELTLWPRLYLFTAPKRSVSSPSEQSPLLDQRRGAARDRFGNWYWIDRSRGSIAVNSVGSDTTSTFWPLRPDALPQPAPSKGDFQPVETPPPCPPLTYSGLAVTEDHYLVVGVVEPAGLLIFDLYGGGPPRQVVWPSSVPFAPFDMAPRPGGGVWILDRTNVRYWALDRHLNVITTDQAVLQVEPGEDATFQPADGSAPQRIPPVNFAEGITLAASSPLAPLDPVAIEALPDDTVLLLAHSAGDNFGAVYRYAFGQQVGAPVSLSGVSALLDVSQQSTFQLLGQDFAFVPAEEAGGVGGQLFVAGDDGMQAFAFALTAAAPREQLTLDPQSDYWPMRLYNGEGLVAVGSRGPACGSGAYYGFDDRWIPLIKQPRPQYVETATLLTSPHVNTGQNGTVYSATPSALDGHEPDCVWHRLMLEGSIPPDTRVSVFSRAANSEKDLALADWQPEQHLYLRKEGSEVPFARKPAQPAAGDGVWELLFQQAQGQYLQLKLELSGNGRSTPRIWALRAYYPRFSYRDHYLPALYRADLGPASFLDRFLANFEGMYTGIEDTVAAVQLLFDVRSAPPDTLAWLTNWFGVALDPAWDELRQRLFLQHAIDFFQYRGTSRGLQMALDLVLAQNPDETIFTGCPGKRGNASSASGIRIVEQFLTRNAPAVIYGDPTAGPATRLVARVGRWTPDQSGAALNARYTAYLSAALSKNVPDQTFPLNAPADGTLAPLWTQFAQEALGFVPSAHVDELQVWQQFLAGRYPNTESLQAVYGVAAAEDVSLPVNLPADGPAAQDWQDFTFTLAPASIASALALWQSFLTRRYQRIAALNSAYNVSWASFSQVPAPDTLPSDGPPLVDWYQFEAIVLAMQRTAHRFTVLLPVTTALVASAADPAQLALAARVLDLEKPAHSVVEVKYYWALFRLGLARLGTDTLLGQGSRAPQLLPPMVLGQNYLSESHLTPGFPQNAADRQLLGRGCLGYETCGCGKE
jgi:phage tail-like protein